jgi:hypothetical protein
MAGGHIRVAAGVSQINRRSNDVEIIETVKVQHKDDPNDYSIINKSDFKEGQHTLFVEKPAEEPKPTGDQKSSKEGKDKK